MGEAVIEPIDLADDRDEPSLAVASIVARYELQGHKKNTKPRSAKDPLERKEKHEAAENTKDAPIKKPRRGAMLRKKRQKASRCKARKKP